MCTDKTLTLLPSLPSSVPRSVPPSFPSLFPQQVYGQASDIVLEVDSTMRENQRFLAELSRLTGRKHEQIKEDFARDFYLSAEESVEYGMVDQVITPGTCLPFLPPSLPPSLAVRARIRYTDALAI